MKKWIFIFGFSVLPFSMGEAALTLRQQVDNTCGACHSQPHLRPPGNYSLNSDAAAHTPGIFATTQGITDPTLPAVGSTDPVTALIIQKPLAGSITLHGGIKISSSHPTMVALIEWVRANTPAGQLDRGNPGSSLYPASALGVASNAADNPTLAYTNTLGAQHVIVYVRRKHNPGGFRNLLSFAPGANLYLQRFNDPNVLVGPEVQLTNFVGEDVQNPTVSLDGTKIAFARMKSASSSWNIWEINADGTGLRQVTQGTKNEFQPFYLPYTPDGLPARNGEGGVGYLSDSANFRDEYETGVTYSLYVSDKDYGHRRQIDFNPSHDIHPWLDSSGMVIFSRWEHNEHQMHNFMSLFQMAAADYLSAGTALFGAFGEHRTEKEVPPRAMPANSYHEPSEILDDTYFGKTDPDLFNPSYLKMIARSSTRDSMGGSIAGPFVPRLQQTAGGSPIEAEIIARGDFADFGREVEMDDLADISSVTFREARSLLNGRYVVSYATAIGRIPTLDTFSGATNYLILYSSWSLYTFTLDGAGKMQNLLPLVLANDDFVDEAVPLVRKPQPPQIAKPIDHTKTTGVFTSGTVLDRNPSDGQPKNLDIDDLSVVRFVRALQLNIQDVDTGREKDEGSPTQLVGEVPIASDGSFAAEVPANVPLQFQVIDKNGRVVVSHKPWVHVAPGATERCVGCHARHDKPAVIQTLVARQTDPTRVNTRTVRQFNYSQDIQPIFTAKCVSCHDSAKTTGAAGRKRGLSLVGRDTPAHITESFQALVGGDFVKTQRSRESELMWWLTGLKLDATPPTAYPTSPVASVPHDQMLTEEDLTKIANWIDTGINFRVVDNDQVGKQLDNTRVMSTFLSDVWPILETNCLPCHRTGGEGELAMDIDGSTNTAEDQMEVDEERLEQVTRRVNFMVPEASVLLRKPLPTSIGGLTHGGSGRVQWRKDTPEYLTIYNWIQAANPVAAAAPPQTDMVNVANYPNPFRNETTFVYGLQGAAATTVQLKIYTQNGKLIRELEGTTVQDTNVGWNKVEWDGKDKNGKTVGNDVYLYTVEATFGDGVKKRFRGKCVKVN